MNEKATTEKNKTEKVESLPEGWKRVRLGEVCKVQCGFAFKSEEFSEEGIPIIKVTNISDQRVTLNDKDSYLPSYKIKFYQDFIIKEKDILVALSGSVGKIGIAKDIKVALLNQRVGRFIINSKVINNTFVFFLLSKNEFYNFILNNSASSAQPNISPSFVESFEIILPPLPEQQKIAEILETVDNAIEKTDAIIEKYRRIKKGLMADLLTGKIRLIPYGHSKAEGEESPLLTSPEAKKFVIGDKTFVAVPNQKWRNTPIGKIPEDWEVRKLGEIGEIIYGERLSEQEYVEDGTSIVYGTTGIIAKTEKYLGVGETIVLPRKGSIDNKFYVESGQKFFVIDTAFYLRFNSKEASNIKFVYYFLYQINLELLNEATGVPSLNRENLKIIFLPLPPLPEQQLIADVLSQVDEVIEKEIQYKEKLERIKKGLMEDLLTGKVRVNNLIKED